MTRESESSNEAVAASDERSNGATSTNFVQASIEELRKVTAPSRQETIQATIVTIFILFFVAICLFIVDVIFNRLMSAIIG